MGCPQRKYYKASSAEAAVAAILDLFDVVLPSAKTEVLVKELAALGGPAKAFANANQASTTMRKMCKVLFASPEAQLC